MKKKHFTKEQKKIILLKLLELIFVILISGLIYGELIYLVWNFIISSSFSVEKITFMTALELGYVIVLLRLVLI